MATTKKTEVSEEQQRKELTQAVGDAYREFYVGQLQPVPVPPRGFLESVAEALYEAGYRK